MNPGRITQRGRLDEYMRIADPVFPSASDMQRLRIELLKPVIGRFRRVGYPG